MNSMLLYWETPVQHQTCEQSVNNRSSLSMMLSRNETIKSKPTKRAVDWRDSARFISIFLASGFSCSQTFSQPARQPLPITCSVKGWRSNFSVQFFWWSSTAGSTAIFLFPALDFFFRERFAAPAAHDSLWGWESRFSFSFTPCTGYFAHPLDFFGF